MAHTLGFQAVLSGTCLCGSVWPCGSDIGPEAQRNREAAACGLGAAPVLLESQMADVPQCPIAAAAPRGIAAVAADGHKGRTVSGKRFPYDLPAGVGHEPHLGGDDPHRPSRALRTPPPHCTQPASAARRQPWPRPHGDGGNGAGKRGHIRASGTSFNAIYMAHIKNSGFIMLGAEIPFRPIER